MNEDKSILDFNNCTPYECNIEAFKDGKIAAENLRKYNPLYIYGPNGSGKSYLERCIENTAFENMTKNDNFSFKDGNLLYKDLIELFEDVDKAVESYSVQNLIIIDPIDKVLESNVGENAIKVFNRLIENGTQIVLTGVKKPKDIKCSSFMSFISKGKTIELFNK